MLSTGKNDLIIGIDPNGCFRIMRMRKGDYNSAEVELLPFSTRAFDAAAGFYSEMESVLSAHFAQKPFAETMAVYLVLPDTTVAADSVNIPVLKRKQMREGLHSELSNLYANYKELQIRTTLFRQNKQYAVFSVFSMRKNVMAECYKSLSAVKLYPKTTTFSAHAAIEAVLHLRPKLRGRSFVFADIHANETHFVITSKGKVSGFATHPLGHMCLLDDKRSLEYMMTDHDVAELAVLNAKELAKAKMLTIGDDDLDSVADSVEQQLHAEAEVSQSGSESENGGVQSTQSEDAVEERTAAQSESEAVTTSQLSDEVAATDEYDEEDEEEVRKAREAAFALKKIKVLRKMPKRFPKFMMRPIPETPQGYISENFRILLKWILLYVDSARRAENVNDPEFVLINMPKNFEYIIDELNADNDNGISFKYFSPQTEDNHVLADNLDLLGITYASKLLF